MTKLIERPVRTEPDERIPVRRHSFPKLPMSGVVMGLVVGIGLGTALFLTIDAPTKVAPAAIAETRYEEHAGFLRDRWLDVPGNVESLRYREYADYLRDGWLGVPGNVESLRYREYAGFLRDGWLGVPRNVESLRYSEYAEWIGARQYR